MSIALKSKMVTFRLTPEDYERVRELCLSHGLGTVSELARTALNSFLLAGPAMASEQSLTERVSELEGRVRILSSDMHRLKSDFTSFRGLETSLEYSSQELLS
jgi:hypothetical protein